jgi:hypothetical protein
MSSKKQVIKELTPEQEALLDVYHARGFAKGTKADPSIDEEKVIRLTNEVRKKAISLDPSTDMLPECENFFVFDSPMAVIRTIPQAHQNNALYGFHDAEWLELYAYCREVLGLVEETEILTPAMALASEIGWWWVGKTTTIVSRRPVAIHLLDKPNNTKVLHNPRGMAVEYIDGEGVYALNGIFIPEKYTYIITRPITYAEALQIDNVEIRNEAIKLAVDKDKIPAKVVHRYKCNVGGNYSLNELTIGDNRRLYLEGNCPSSGKRFFEAVEPNCQTCQEALSFREFGDRSVPWVPPKART